MTEEMVSLNFDVGELIDTHTGQRFDHHEAQQAYTRDPERWNQPWPQHDPGDPVLRIVCTEGPWWNNRK